MFCGSGMFPESGSLGNREARPIGLMRSAGGLAGELWRSLAAGHHRSARDESGAATLAAGDVREAVNSLPSGLPGGGGRVA